MAAIPPSNPNPSGENQNLQPLPSFEDNLNVFWQKNRMIVLGLCAFVLLAILGKGLWERMQEQKEMDIQKAYAAATTPEQLRGFVSAHHDHPLVGIAELRMADEAYAAGKSGEAVAGYEKASAVLKNGPLAARAQLGRSLAKVQAGKATEAVAELKQIAGNANNLKAVRAEALYHLASLAADSGDSAEVQKQIEQLNQVDPGSMWSRRAMALQSAPSKSAAPAAVSPGTPTPAAGEQSPSVQVKLPGK